MCECLEHEDGGMYLCPVDADHYREMIDLSRPGTTFKVKHVYGGRGAKPRETFRAAAKSGYWRAPGPYERYVALAQVDTGLRDWEQRYYGRASNVIRKMWADVVSRVRSVIINARNYSTLFANVDGPNVKYRGELRQAVLTLLRKTPPRAT